MAETTITSLMMQHHSVIVGLLNNLKTAVKKDAENIRAEFAQFERQAKEHFSIEETVIFEFSKTLDAKRTEIILSLMREHQIMLSLMDVVLRGLPENDYSGVYELEDVLIRHATTEETILYPGLDENLPTEKKEVMIKRIQETSGELLIIKS